MINKKCERCNKDLIIDGKLVNGKHSLIVMRYNDTDYCFCNDKCHEMFIEDQIANITYIVDDIDAFFTVERYYIYLDMSAQGLDTPLYLTGISKAGTGLYNFDKSRCMIFDTKKELDDMIKKLPVDSNRRIGRI